MKMIGLCVLALSTATGAAHAQGEALEEVTVTGSRVQLRDGMTTPTPVTTVTMDELNSMAPGNMIDAFDQLPQFIGNDSRGTAASKADSAGASNLNLRGLGSQRQLVLLDGRRIVPSNRHSTTDISLLPQSLIRNVEVVTGGASAAYGSDAVTGVVNFLLDTDFTGFKADAQIGSTSRGDDDSRKFSVTAGMPIGNRMHLVFAAEQFDADGTDDLSDRDWYQRQGRVTNPVWAATGEGPRLLTLPDVVSTEATHGGMINAPGTSLHRQHFLPNGTITPFIVSDVASVGTGTHTQSVTNGGSGENFRDDRPTLVGPEERESAFVNLDFDLTENFSLFGSALFGQQETSTPGTLPLGYGTRALTIYQENAFLSDDIRQVMIDEGITSFRLERLHSSADIARDVFINRNRTASGTFGFDGTLREGFFDDWRINGYYQWGQNENRLTFRDFFRRDTLPRAADAVLNGAGEIVCNVTLYDPTSGCVPINLLGTGNASPEAIDYVTGPDMFVTAETQQQVAEVALDGEVGESWAGPILMAFGASYRKEEIDQTLGPDEVLNGYPPDDPSQGRRGTPPAWDANNHNIVFRGTDLDPIQGGFDVKEVFAEAVIPLVSDSRLVQQVDLSLASRWADYGGSGSAVAWKAGTEVRINDALRLRGTFSHDVRAGNLAERFDRQQQSATVEDPQFNNAQYITRQIFGGNPEVDPEEADTVTMGVVFQPTRLEGFSVSLDWTDIELDGRIGQLGVQTIVDDCAAGALELCALVSRDPVTNEIVTVFNTFLNVDQSRVTATDLELRYDTEVGQGGALASRVLITRLGENSITNRGAAKDDRVGEGDFAEYRALASVSYSRGPFVAYVQERYTSSGYADTDFVEGVDIDDNSVDAAWYTDVRLSYAFDQEDSEWQIYGNINNLFDADPEFPWNASRFSGSTLPNYEVLGRRYTLGFRFNF